jgi:hypothetical protein
MSNLFVPNLPKKLVFKRPRQAEKKLYNIDAGHAGLLLF